MDEKTHKKRYWMVFGRRVDLSSNLSGYNRQPIMQTHICDLAQVNSKPDDRLVTIFVCF